MPLGKAPWDALIRQAPLVAQVCRGARAKPAQYRIPTQKASGPGKAARCDTFKMLSLLPQSRWPRSLPLSCSAWDQVPQIRRALPRPFTPRT